MKHWTLLFASLILVIVTMLGCSNGKGGITPPLESSGISLITSDVTGQGNARTQLWGYYDLVFDFEEGSVEVISNRSVEYAVNVVKFINNDPAGLQISVNGTSPSGEFVDIDMDVTIKHPMGIEKFTGYDVRGVFIGNGSDTMQYGDGLAYPYRDQEQILLNADGYTRWYNPVEFTSESIFGYVPGKFASKNYTLTSMVNGYKYFAEGLNADGDVFEYLSEAGPETGYFLAGSSNTRNYQIRFPVPSPGIKYGYAIVANWEGGDPEFHPSHAPEAIAVSVTDSSELFFVNMTENGGYINLQIEVFNWDASPVSGVMEEYRINIESDVLSSVYTLDPFEMTPVSGDDEVYMYEVEILADDVTGTAGNEVWVIVESPELDYSNPFGILNDAGDDRLASFFRFDLEVSDEVINYHDGWAESWGGTGDDEVESVVADYDENIFVTGYFKGTVDLDPGEGEEIHTSNGDRDVYLSKFDPK